MQKDYIVTSDKDNTKPERSDQGIRLLIKIFEIQYDQISQFISEETQKRYLFYT